jgi:carbamoyl-phosphate synthase large subunit
MIEPCNSGAVVTETPVLLLAPHWRVPLVRAFAHARDRLDLKGKLICADSDPLSSSLVAGDSACILPPFSDPECLKKVLELCSAEGVRAVLPLTNKAVEFVDSHRSAFDADQVHLYVSPPSAIEICHDKLKLNHFLVSQGILTPRIYESPLEADGFPLFAKKRCGEGGEDTFLIQDYEDLGYVNRRFPDHIVQSFIAGREFTIDWFGGGGMNFSAPRERLKVRAGEARVTQLRMDAMLIEKASQLAGILQLSGPACLQGILDSKNEFYFTDVNLRFGSGVMHTILAGGDIPEMIYRELAGLEPSERIIQEGSVMTRFSDGFLLKGY